MTIFVWRAFQALAHVLPNRWPAIAQRVGEPSIWSVHPVGRSLAIVRHLILSAGIISALTLSTNVLGFFRELLFARAFGVGQEADAYVTAFSIVATCFLVFSAGSLQGAFMPRYQQAIVKAIPSRARGLWLYSLIGLCLILAVIVVTITLGAESVVAWVVPGFSELARSLTAQVLRWLAPMVFLFSLGALMQSVMHANQRFLLPALVPALNNLVLIASLLLLVPSFGLIAFGYGSVLGAALWLTLLPGVLTQLPKAPAKFEPRELRALLLSMLPLVILLLADQLSGLVQKTLVSDLETGSIAVLNYAARLEGLPVGIFASAIAAAFFPALVDALARRDPKAVAERFSLGLAGTCFFAVPAMLFLMVESKQVVKVLLERGAFGPEASLRAAQALSWYALGLLPQSLIVFLNRVYFANGDTRTPMAIGVFTAAIHVLFCWLLVNQVGYLGIAMGTSLYAFMYCMLLLARLGSVIDAPLRHMWAALWRAAVAGFVMVLVLMFFDFTESISGFLLALAAGSSAYLAVALLLRDPVLAAWRITSALKT